MNKGTGVKYNWNLLEELFVDQGYKAIKELLKINADQVLYAVAFYATYREQDGKLQFPMLAVNSTQGYEQNNNAEDDEGFFSIKWNPYDWKWGEIDLSSNELNDLENRLQAEAIKSTPKHWVKVENNFMKCLVRASKRLYMKLKKENQVTKDFVVFFHDEDGGSDLAKKCINQKLFFKLFPELDETAQERNLVAGFPVMEQVEYYIDRLGKHDGIDGEEAESKLIELGELSINSLINKLNDSVISWKVAGILGRISIADTIVLAALRNEVENGKEAALWSAMSLGLLGDIDYLHELNKSDRTRLNGVNGITARYRSWANNCKQIQPLNYTPLKTLLENGCDDCSKIAMSNLEPGNSYCDITINDVDEALGALNSPHQLIRQHAICILGDRSLGKKIALKVLPALAERLSDQNSEIRRLAVLNLSFWKKDAVKYRSNIERLLQDESEKVRTTANNVLTKLL